ncbi:hypothetical protein DFA_00380 [Cavenderia fasciculata]|uniref:Uncharacterized protein n=1 Tax=Cavenderia fasciculata TaxID=261658 RepID=F4PRG7_CACFS|nr:uncharacterized protein DFA_00380 [Cavenderia fasciculata]EGG20519.1 hypothetical protein DFA_00380 [Cavenderia fasciculata]|eukprot:XP_004358369.1 hypothetical protein DFA_00380 [Cavenderia fasciculata]
MEQQQEEKRQSSLDITFISIFRMRYLRRIILNQISTITRQCARVRSRDIIIEGKGDVESQQQQQQYKGPDHCIKTYYNANNLKWLLVNGYSSLLKDKYNAGHIFEEDTLYSWMEYCTEQSPMPSALIDKVIANMPVRNRENDIKKAIVGGNLILLEKLLMLYAEDMSIGSMSLIYEIASKSQNYAFKQFVTHICIQQLDRYNNHHGRDLLDYSPNQQHCTIICKMIMGVDPKSRHGQVRIPDTWTRIINRDLIMEFDIQSLAYMTDEMHIIPFNLVALYDFVESVLCNPLTIQDQHMATIKDIWRLIMYRHVEIFNSRDSIEKKLIDQFKINKPSLWNATTPVKNEPFTFKQLVDLFYFIDMVSLLKVEYRTLDENIACSMTFLGSLTVKDGADYDDGTAVPFHVAVDNYLQTFVPKSWINYLSVFKSACLVCSVSVVQYFEQKMVSRNNTTESLHAIYGPTVRNDPQVLSYVAPNYTYRQETLENILIYACKTDHVEMISTIIQLYSYIVVEALEKLLVESGRADSLNTFLLLIETYPEECVGILCTRPILDKTWKPSYFVLKHYNKIHHLFQSSQCHWIPRILNYFIELAIIFCNLSVIKKLLLLPRLVDLPDYGINLGLVVPYKPLLDFFFDATMNPRSIYVPGKHFNALFGNFCWTEAAHSNDTTKLDILFQLGKLSAPRNQYERTFSIEAELQVTIYPVAFKNGHVNLIQYCNDTYNVPSIGSNVFLKQEYIKFAITCNSIPIIKHCIKLIQSTPNQFKEPLRMSSGPPRLLNQKKLKRFNQQHQQPTLLEFMFDTATTLNQKEIINLLYPLIKAYNNNNNNKK